MRFSFVLFQSFFVLVILFVKTEVFFLSCCLSTCTYILNLATYVNVFSSLKNLSALLCFFKTN